MSDTRVRLSLELIRGRPPRHGLLLKTCKERLEELGYEVVFEMDAEGNNSLIIDPEPERMYRLAGEV